MSEGRNSVIPSWIRAAVGWLSVFCLALLSLAGLWWIQAANEFFPNVTVGDVLIGGLPWAAGEKAVLLHIEETQNSSPVHIQLSPQTSGMQELEWDPTMDRLGISIDPNATLLNAWSVGRSGSWNDRLTIIWTALRNEPISIPYALTIDQEKLNQYILALAQTINVPRKEPSLTIQNHQFVFVEGQTGIALQTEQFLTDLKAAIANQTFESPVELTVVTMEPTLNPAQVKEVRDFSQIILARDITLTSQQKTWTVTKEQIEDWIVFDELGPQDSGNLIYSIPDPSLEKTFSVNADTEKIQAYLVELGKEVNASPTPRIEKSAAQKTLVIEEGSDGVALNIPDMTRRIVQSLLESSNREIALAMETVERPRLIQENPEPPMKEGKVIAIDLTTQTIYGYENGDLLYFARTSTGRPPYYTNPGQWKIYYKTRRQTMSGPGYSLPNVQWTMFYDRGYGIHGTYWHNNFGTPMSHGCTNLTNEDAKWFWEWAPVGTAVHVYGETPRV
jgi:vancomycin resistance protein YoaR